MNRVEQAGKESATRSVVGVMEQIAVRVGCSKSTVSRVLSGRGKNFSVRPVLEQKILKIARELDYQPNPFLQSMRNQDSRIIAVFDPVLGHYPMIALAKGGFVDAVRDRGYIVTGSYVRIYRLHEYTVPFPIIGSLLFDISDHSFLSFFEKKGIPYLVVNGICLENGMAIQIDEEVNAAQLISHLVEFGHRKIAYFSAHPDHGTPGQHYSGFLRQQNFNEELRRNGLELPDGDGDAIHSPPAFLRHHVLKCGVTAVVCYNYVRVQQIMHAAWELGVKVPEQLSIVCFDDDGSIERMTPPVTCCAFSAYDIGLEAGRLLLARLGGDLSLAGQVHKVPGKLICRQSVARIDSGRKH